jgi:hypothetical protein
MRQLSIGGTLVMPVGEPAAVQNLVKVRRLGEEDFEQEDLGPVRFVPLIGEHGWDGGEGPEKPRPTQGLPSPRESPDRARRLPSTDEPCRLLDAESPTHGRAWPRHVSYTASIRRRQVCGLRRAPNCGLQAV